MEEVIEAKSIPTKKINVKTRLAEFCWYYPQYSLAVARKMPAKDIILMLGVARKKEAEKYLNLINIVAAPHSKKGKDVKKLVDIYKNIIDGD